MRCRAEGGRKGRRRAELWVGPRSGLAPASAAAPERSGWRGPPFGSLALRTGPLDAARSRTRAGSLRPSPISGPRGARSTVRAVRLGSVFWERRSLWRPISGSPACLQGPGELSLSLCGRRRVWTRSQGGDVSHTWLPAPRAPWKPRCHADRCHAAGTGAFTHPPGQAPKARQQDTWGSEAGRLHVICIPFARAVIPGLLPRPGPADAGSVLSPEPDLTA